MPNKEICKQWRVYLTLALVIVRSTIYINNNVYFYYGKKVFMSIFKQLPVC